MTLDGKTIGGAVGLQREVVGRLLGDSPEQLLINRAKYAAWLSEIAALLQRGGPATGCERCGNAVPVNRTGRPRKFCIACSPRHAERSGKLSKSPN